MTNAVTEFVNDRLYPVDVKCLGIPDRFVAHGTVHELYRECGYDPESIADAVKNILQRQTLLHVV